MPHKLYRAPRLPSAAGGAEGRGFSLSQPWPERQRCPCLSPALLPVLPSTQDHPFTLGLSASPVIVGTGQHGPAGPHRKGAAPGSRGAPETEPSPPEPLLGRRGPRQRPACSESGVLPRQGLNPALPAPGPGPRALPWEGVTSVGGSWDRCPHTLRSPALCCPSPGAWPVPGRKTEQEKQRSS